MVNFSVGNVLSSIRLPQPGEIWELQNCYYLIITESNIAHNKAVIIGNNNYPKDRTYPVILSEGAYRVLIDEGKFVSDSLTIQINA